MIYKYMNAKWREILVKFISFGALLGLFYSFIMPMEIGIMNALAIPPFYIYEPVFIKILKLLFLIPLLVLWFIIFQNKQK